MKTIYVVDMELAKRTKGRRTELGLSQDQLGELCKVSQQAINKIENGETLNPRFILELAQALQTTPEWLKQGKGTVDLEPPAIEPSFIPVKGLAQAGEWVTAEEAIPDEIQWVMLPEPIPGYGDLFAVRAIGDSMDEFYPDGSLLICQNSFTYDGPIVDGDHVIVQRRNADGDYEVTVKELSVPEEGQPWLVPRSTKHHYDKLPFQPDDDWHKAPDEDAGADNIYITGIVVACWTRRKKAELGQSHTGNGPASIAS